MWLCDVSSLSRGRGVSSMTQMHHYGPPMSSLSAWRCMHCWPTCVFMFVHSFCCMCVFVYRTPAQFKPLHRLLRVENSDTDVRSLMERRLKPIQTLSPLDPSLEWLDKQVPFPNCVWRGNRARRAAAGPMAGAKRVHFVQHTRRIWGADVLSAAIQLQP